MALAGGGGGVAAAADAGLRLATRLHSPPSFSRGGTERAAPSSPRVSRQPTRRPPRRFLNAPYADSAEGPRPFRTAPTRSRSGGRADLAARRGSTPLPSPPPAPAPPPSPSPPPPRSSLTRSLLARLPEYATVAASGSAPSARRESHRSPHVLTPASPSPGSVISSRSVSGGGGEGKTARRPFWNRARSGARKRHGGRGALPEVKMAASSDGMGEVVPTPPSFSGAILGASLVHTRLAEFAES
ncbi:uncharacterized protein LJ264_000576 [Porphyrio hochstetteri]